jgi:Tfp pilus assembly protein PilF
LRLSVALIDGPSERKMWSATYERPLENILVLYQEVALAVAAEMGPPMTVTGGGGTASARPVNPEAYDAYLRASYFLGNRWMAGGCRDAERYLLRSIEIDPRFAPAHAALAWCYAYPDRIGRDIAEIGPKAKAAVARALELDERLALAHVVAGTIHWRVDYEPVAAETEFRRALALDPGSGLVNIPYGELLIWRGDRGRGLALLRRAVQLEPFSPDRNVQVGFGLMTAGLYPAAIEQLRKALELDPNYATARLWMAESYAYAGDHDRAVSEYLAWLDGALLSPQAASVRPDLERAYARNGWTGFWRAELALVERDAARRPSLFKPPYDRYTGAWYLARRYARLGDREQALAALERAYAARHHLVATLGVDPLFEKLRDEERFRALLAATRGGR